MANAIAMSNVDAMRHQSLSAVVLILATGFAATAMAACPAPGANQAVVYTDPNFGGNCAVLVIGPWPMSDLIEAGIPNDSISSISVGSGVRVVLYENDPFSGRQADYESGSYATLTNGVDEQTSSLRVQANNGHRIAFQHIGDHPSDRENFWTADEQPQGLAHNATDWFLTSNQHIYRVPLSEDISEDNPIGGNTVGMPPELANQGYNHFGDPDVFDDWLFVPVENAGANVYPAIAVFRASDLAFVTWDIFFDAVQQSDGTYKSAWLSVGDGGVVYTSDSNPTSLTIYNIDFAGLCTGCGYYLLTGAVGSLALKDWYGQPNYGITTTQGGDLSSDGSLIYITDSNENRIRVFDTSSGLLQAISEDEYGLFDYKWAPTQEAEGVDYFDTDPGVTPNIGGTLHALLYAQFGGGYWLKNYSL